jgi:hypothetical protein
MAKKVIIRVNTKTGEKTVETSGFTGKECVAEAEAFKAAIGGQRGSIRKTPEYHRVAQGAGAGNQAEQR